MLCTRLNLQTVKLEIDESSFTGETEPAQKNTAPLLKSNGHSSKTNMAFMGTLVRSGNGKVRKLGTRFPKLSVLC